MSKAAILSDGCDAKSLRRGVGFPVWDAGGVSTGQWTVFGAASKGLLQACNSHIHHHRRQPGKGVCGYEQCGKHCVYKLKLCSTQMAVREFVTVL